MLLVCGRKAPREVTWCEGVENPYIEVLLLPFHPATMNIEYRSKRKDIACMTLKERHK